MVILEIILIFCAGASVGFVIKSWMAHRFENSAGIIYVEKNEETMRYTLELTEDPETLQFKKRVIFRIDSIE